MLVIGDVIPVCRRFYYPVNGILRTYEPMNQLVWLIRWLKQSFYFAMESNGNRYGLTIQYYHILWYEYLYNMYICTIVNMYCIYLYTLHITCSFIEIMFVLFYTLSLVIHIYDVYIYMYIFAHIWANYNDLNQPHPKCSFVKEGLPD